ncbi:MAG: flagellar basal body rod protein FlgB [Sedimentisphaerales bacterium]|nr:flagellar basal body rod protein FlgB [Sedimentisphaerales bacterium]
MSRTENIFDFLDAGIRAENLRQKSIANNIANHETPGYRRLDVKFEEILAKSLDEQGSVEMDDLEPLLFSPKDSLVKENGNDVNMENEVGQLIENSMRYKAYVRLLNKKFQQIESAIDIR